MTDAETDTKHMRRALDLARAVRCLTPPNPAVGCVIVGADGQVIGEGATQRTGGPHAEVMALRDVAARGASTQGASAYVTLEPCSHTGRTPPCADALVRAGLARVVVAVGDPNPRVQGAGNARLRAAGIRVDVGLLSEEAARLNVGFFSRMTRGRPWVRAKLAASLDGRTALPDGRSQWITSEAARQDGHHYRARAGVLLTGIGTVLADDPRLDVRLGDSGLAPERPPARLIVDSHWRTPPFARLFGTPGAVWIAGGPASESGAAAVQARARLEAQGARCVELPGPNGRVDLSALLQWLGTQEINEVHVEAGAHLTGALVEAELVDEWLLYLAPRALGPGRAMLERSELPDLAAAPRWRWFDSQLVGEDLRLRARRTD